MTILSMFKKDNATLSKKVNSNPRSVLNGDNINRLAKAFKIHFRSRKMDYPILIGSALELATNNKEDHMMSIELLRQQFQRDAGVTISAKCFHNRLDQEGLGDFGKELLCQCLQSYAKLYAQTGSVWYDILMKKLGVDDIILVDGTEITVRETLSKECNCKGKHGAALKLHVAFSLKKQCFEHISVTQAVDSERAEVHPEKYKNTLFIMDAGYMGQELEERIVKTGNHFLVKGKTNGVGKVIIAQDDHGKLIEGCYGKKHTQLPTKHSKRRRVDMLVQEDNREVRIIRAKNKARDEDKEVFAYLRTSLPSSTASAFQIHQLYRFRWLVEIFMKCMKSGNNLQGINSSKREIIMFWIAICLMSTVLKSIVAQLAMHMSNTPILSLLKVQDSSYYAGFFIKLITLKDSQYYEVRNKLLENISSNCQRTRPSMRDCHKLKDIVLLLKSVIKNRSIIKWDLKVA